MKFSYPAVSPEAPVEIEIVATVYEKAPDMIFQFDRRLSNAHILCNRLSSFRVICAWLKYSAMPGLRKLSIFDSFLQDIRNGMGIRLFFVSS